MNIAIYTLRSIAQALINPYLVIILVFIGFIFYRQNKKTSIMQKMIIGESLNSPLELTLSQIVIGIFAGTIASMALSYGGVMFGENSGIDLIFIFSILLMTISPRFICFSYSGAILGFVSLVFKTLSINNIDVLSSLGVASDILMALDITALMTLVGVLHIVEGILVIIDGHRGAIPVFTNKDDKIIGGFALKRYWALPIAIFLILNNNTVIGGESIGTPDWWPLINHSLSSNILQTAVLGLMPFYGVIGYNSVTFTRNKKEKALLSGVSIFIFGIALTLVAQLATKGLVWQFIVVFFAPLAHELMLYVQRYMEEKGKPKFVSDDEGIMVLEVSPNSPAYEMGIKSGDKVLQINDDPVDNEISIYKFISKNLQDVRLKIKDSKGLIRDMHFDILEGNKKIGIVLVPKVMPKESTVVKFEDEKFKDILDKLKHKDKDDEDK